MSKIKIAGAWVLVTTLVTVVTWQIVNAADAQVSDRAPLQVAAPLATAPDSTTTSVLITTSSSETGPTTSSTLPSATSSTSTNAGSSSTSTSTTEGSWSSRTIPTGGGIVVVSYREGGVVLSSATPAAGFAAEVKKQGPPTVDVEFESESAKFRVKAEWSNGLLDVEIDEDD